jgi:hypothetical protein
LRKSTYVTAAIVGNIVSVVAFLKSVDHHAVATHGVTYIWCVHAQRTLVSTFDGAGRRTAIRIPDITIVATLSVKTPSISTYCSMCDDAQRACETYVENDSLVQVRSINESLFIHTQPPQACRLAATRNHCIDACCQAWCLIC